MAVAPVAVWRPSSTFVLPMGAAAGVACMVLRIFDVSSSRKSNTSETVGTGTQSEPSPYAMLEAISRPPASVIPARGVSGDRLNRRAFDEFPDSSSAPYRFLYACNASNRVVSKHGDSTHQGGLLAGCCAVANSACSERKRKATEHTDSLQLAAMVSTESGRAGGQ